MAAATVEFSTKHTSSVAWALTEAAVAAARATYRTDRKEPANPTTAGSRLALGSCSRSSSSSAQSGLCPCSRALALAAADGWRPRTEPNAPRPNVRMRRRLRPPPINEPSHRRLARAGEERVGLPRPRRRRPRSHRPRLQLPSRPPAPRRARGAQGGMGGRQRASHLFARQVVARAAAAAAAAERARARRRRHGGPGRRHSPWLVACPAHP